MIGKWLCSSRNLSYAFASFYGIRGAPSRVPNVTVIPDGVHPSVALERPSSKKATFYCVEFFPLSHGLLRPFLSCLFPPNVPTLTRCMQCMVSRGRHVETPTTKSSRSSRSPTKSRQWYCIALDPATWLAEKEAMIQHTAGMEENAEVEQLVETEDGKDEGAAELRYLLSTSVTS